MEAQWEDGLVTATVRIAAALRFFLPLRHRSGVCEVPLSTLGHAVEALGAAH